MNANRLKDIPLECLSGGGPAIATGTAPDYPYVDGTRDKSKVIGQRVTVVFPANGYEAQTVRVANPVDRLSAVLEQAKGRPVYVSFTNFTARVYIMDGRVGVSAKADDVSVVPDDLVEIEVI